jgi:hypothetical protein
MAKRKQPYLGKATGCQLLEAFLLAQEKQGEGRRAWWEACMARSPHLRPCPKHHGWWLYAEACDFCPDARREP